MANTGNLVLEKMLERLYASLSSGPSLNCRPHQSRQRIDLAQLAKLDGPEVRAALGELLGASRKVRFAAPLADQAVRMNEGEEATPGISPEERAKRRAAAEQHAVVRKLSLIAEDALAFENETGARVLQIGFPLLSIPPAGGGKRFGVSRRILAPIAFIPVTLSVKRGKVASVTIEATEDGVDRVIANPALLAWLEAQTGEKSGDLFLDLEGADPWREIGELVALVTRLLGLPGDTAVGPESNLVPTPMAEDDEKGDVRIVPAAVLGLYPLSNQNLIRDVRALLEGEPITGPIESFLRADAHAGPGSTEAGGAGAAVVETPRRYETEHPVVQADPCQARAVRTAREARGLVVHGPPGTGKSQTIANMIGDHLARGERVLFVCDKRTALDVVKFRLDAIGLGGLCAVVHDPQRDQRDLYLGIRQDLEVLPEAQTSPVKESERARIDRELETLHAELSTHDRAIEKPLDSAGGRSFHQLAGEWLDTEVPGPTLAAAETTRSLGLLELEAKERDARETLDRGVRVAYAVNPWRDALGTDLPAFLARSSEETGDAIRRVSEAARTADASAHPAAPPFAPEPLLAQQAEARASLAQQLTALSAAGHAPVMARWAAAGEVESNRARDELRACSRLVEVLQAGPLDPELASSLRLAPMPAAERFTAATRLAAYLAIARKWYRFLFFFRRNRAASVVARFGLTISVAAAERIARFLEGIRAREALGELERRLVPELGEAPDDAKLLELIGGQTAAFSLLERIADPALAPIAPELRAGLADPAKHASLADALAAAPARGSSLEAFDREVEAAALFAESWRAAAAATLRNNGLIAGEIERLAETLPTVESILRIRAILAAAPPALASALEALLLAGVGVDEGWNALRKSAIAGELSRRVAAEPILQRLDGDALAAMHRRFGELQLRKIELVRRIVVDRWTELQKNRLLTATGSRLNGAGAELKRRLLVRGERALRIRQVIAAGRGLPGGDPIFDLRPVWMGSPESVAQIFPREPIFDVVIFDESSQCRLEEALPVLTRGRRVVVAGDPKQLPPTRFFESMVAESEAVAAETEQEFFEQQQAETEDLLTAALNLAIEQAYLDVHYRSQNADLIQFSNTNFYGSRLQAVPGHPSNRPAMAPVRLISVGGTYGKRANPREAEEVVRIVRELLASPKPSSIGIACFNLSQRDSILDALDEAAATDVVFAEKLAAARARRGQGSFEGLFVKNLENVQGDERDHLIISTTYGPDEKGRFYRRFGPLGMAGGGRRLNVLVTRARQQVHVVTSIPPEVYRNRPELEPGQTPGGAWLLFAYLEYAERLGRLYGDGRDLTAVAAANDRSGEPRVEVRPSGAPSVLPEALARQLARAHGSSTTVHWGNDGFAVDVALRQPANAEEVTLGLLCDGTRFPKASDRVEWDLFRAGILEGQGWRLLRVWSPELFRDPTGALDRIAREHARAITGGPATESERPMRAALP